VASRQQEKEQRRAERVAREEAARKSKARKKRLQYVVGGVLAVAIVAGIVAVVALGLGGGDSDGEAADPSEASASVDLPAQKSGDLKAAAKTAGCKLSNPEIEGATHETKNFAPGDYKTNPPTSGNHNPDWYEDGVYNPGDTPRLGMLVHTLEHGRIDVQYKEGTPPEDVTRLEALLAESDGYHMLLFQNTTGMDAAVAATAWGHSVTCPEMNDSVFDVLRTFRASYIDKGPEAVP
jgi:Protein of unknown function (DUF3105)